MFLLFASQLLQRIRGGEKENQHSELIQPAGHYVRCFISIEQFNFHSKHMKYTVHIWIYKQGLKSQSQKYILSKLYIYEADKTTFKLRLHNGQFVHLTLPFSYHYHWEELNHKPLVLAISVPSRVCLPAECH